MKVIELLASRRDNWRELEALCHRWEASLAKRPDAGQVTRFAFLYRAACADLALADAYQLPPATVEYLHQLVGRAHNQMYRGRGFDFAAWLPEMLGALPRRLLHDNSLRLATVIFWGMFVATALLAYFSPVVAERVLGKDMVAGMEQMYDEPIEGRDADESTAMAGFYTYNNPGIGLQCFACGLLLGIGGLFITISNAAILGAVFGHMAAVPQHANFFHFVTAHGPFELSAVVLAAAAGMRLGFSIVDTRGWQRGASLRRAARDAVPSICASIVLFALAALIEAFISPSALPYWSKAAVAIVSTLLMLFFYWRWAILEGPTLQLDKTRVAIRERSLLDIMDLAVRVIRGHLSPLVAAWLIGALPWALLNAWVLASRYPNDASEDVPGGYLWHLAVLMIWEIPLATAPVTLYLGQALFVAEPSRRELFGQYVSRLGQLIWYQGILRGCLPVLATYGYVARIHGSLQFVIELAMCITWLFVAIVWPYQNEVLLLERSPWRGHSGRGGTWTRTRNMHAQASFSLFGRWIVSLTIAALLLLAGTTAMNWVRATLSFDRRPDAWTYQGFVPLAAWIVIGYFATVRFLSYLDLRIRSEGWEVELLLRAEGARLARQVA